LCSIGIKYGAEAYVRNKNLATDSSLIVDVIHNFWVRVKSEGESGLILVLLEATSPFRTPELVSRCIARLVSENLDSIATFHEATINPERTWKIIDGNPIPFIEGAIPWKPRQLLETAYQLDGGVYAFYPDRLPVDSPSLLFGKTGAEVILGGTVIDIDSPINLEMANAFLRIR
jgi:CMP-N-acetylneuraminic acid synthetase